MKLNEIISKPIHSFDDLFHKEVSILSFPIDCSLFSEPQYDKKFAEYENQAKELMGFLHEIKSPCIYWFEVEDTGDCTDIIKDLDAFRTKNTGRSVPAKNRNHSSKVLYVGVRKGGFRKVDGLTNIAGRLAIHLGYYKIGSTQGLQLCHWAKGYKLKINIIVLPNDADMFLNVLEKQLAHQLKPMCGRHR